MSERSGSASGRPATIVVEGMRARAPNPLERVCDRVSPRVRHLVTSAAGASFFVLFAYAHIRASLDSGRVLGVGVGVFGLWMAILFFVRRPASDSTASIAMWGIAFLGTFGSSLLRPGGPDPTWADPVGLTLQGIGLIFGAFGLSALARSLGVVPANRGIVSSGVYRVVRHPLYASYIVVDLGYLAQSPRLWNAAVLCSVWTCQVLRMLSEERLLSRDPEYRRYVQQTRWRLLPHVW